MAKKHDTDTLTKIDLTPDAPTIKSEFSGDDAETHKLDPRVWAPLRVCPQCSLAWEVTGDWCPSCGTAFDKSVREAQASPTRVMSQTQVARRHGGEPPLKRSERRQRSAEAAHPPAAPPPARAPKRSGGAGKAIGTVLAVCLVAVTAFLAGQATRPSSSEVDRRTSEAAQTARASAAASYRRAFQKMQDQAAKAIADARSKALAEGEAKAQAQIQQQADNSQSIFDSVTACVLHADC